MRLPSYSDPSSVFQSLQTLPPFDLPRVMTHVFPLRASLTGMQQFCDSYLNIIPPELGHFRAFMPYAYLMMLDYGRLAGQTMNFGWVSQHEILFAIPVEWYRAVNGRWEFHDWAWVSPYIFVDSEMSLALGRTVYGWPKLLAWMTPELSLWMKDPRSPVNAATISTEVFDKAYAGTQQARRVFFQVQREAPASPFQVSPDLRSPFMPWNVMYNAANDMTQLMRDSMSLLMGLGRMPVHPWAMFAPLLNRLSQTRQAPFGESPLYYNTLNLKQFRDSQSPQDYCYQALTNAKMRTLALNAGGLLGDMSTLAGDLSGGYSILLNRWPLMPIIETLGLEVEQQWRGDGVDVARLKPVLPFWYDVDMRYERAENVAWRSLDRRWHDAEGRTYEPLGTNPELQRLCNTTWGAASQEVAGPFQFTDTTARVMPLLADRKTLQRFLERYLNVPLESAGMGFQVWGPSEEDSPYAYVYLVATNFGDITSGSNNVGNWTQQELTFYVPVQWWCEDAQGTRQLRSLGLVPAFSFVDDATAVVSDSEVLGVNATGARFISPPNCWMSDDASWRKNQRLLQVSTEVLPSLDSGQESETCAIVEVEEGLRVSHDATRLRAESAHWGLILQRELERKKRTQRDYPEEMRNARALALGMLGTDLPCNIFTLKQFRDAREPARACFQSLVLTPRKLENIYDIHELEEPLHVRIHQYPTQPMVDLLGLVAKLADEQDGGAVYTLQPLRSFWVRLAFTEELGQRVCYRGGSEEWKGLGDWEKEHLAKSYFHAGSSPKPRLGKQLVALINGSAPRNLKDVVCRWRESTDRGMAPEEALAAVTKIDPQMVLDTLLSREWENWSEDVRWFRRRRRLSRELKAHLSRAAMEERTREETVFFNRVLKTLLARPHQPLLLDSVRQKIDLRQQFGQVREHMEHVYSALAAVSGEDPQTVPPSSVVDRFHQALQLLYSVLAAHPQEQARFHCIWKTLQTLCGKSFEKQLWLMDKKELEALAQVMMTQIWARYVLERQSILDLMAFVREEHERQRDALLDMLSKSAQKPDFCVPRHSVGVERERLFPLEESWDDKWYVGPRVK